MEPPPLDELTDRLYTLQRQLTHYVNLPHVHCTLETQYLDALIELEKQDKNCKFKPFHNWYKRHMGVEEL